LLAWLVRSIRKKSFGFVKPFLHLPREQRLDFIKLGIATWIVYVVTIYGIGKLGSPVFNLIDYCIMPVLTLLTARLINRERTFAHHIAGALFSACGIVLILRALILDPPTDPYWRIWIALSFLSPIFTSVCNSLQKRQVDQKMTPDEVLLYRFPIPAVLMAVWFYIAKLYETDVPVGAPLHYLPRVLLAGAVAVFLPLWLLCYGFIRSSVVELARYLPLIAVFTFVLARLLLKGQWNLVRLPEVWVAAALLLVGYLLANGLIMRRRVDKTT